MIRKLGVCLAVALLLVCGAWAQKVTGSISGTVSDPSGAAVPGAKVSVTNEATGFKAEMVSNSEGGYLVPDLPPSVYKLRITANGFQTFETVVTVRVGVAANIEAKLTVGQSSSVITVESSAVTVDTVKATVQGVVEASRIEQLPLNGRNFLDLAQQEPGVQIVDGGTFDPTKNQFAGVSIGGRSGRVTRIQVDGVDITDETVGTTVTNISNESIQEFGISQSSLDISTDVTSSGAVNIITRSGTNQLHGSGAFFFRNQALGADQRLNKTVPSTTKPSFDREIVATRVGGPLIKDKLFWHAEFEYNNQDGQRFTNIPEFPQFTGSFAVPLDERLAGIRADWKVNDSWSAFYRFNHNYNNGVTGFGARDLTAFSNLNNTNFHVMGADFHGMTWSHSVRFSYLNFNNGIVDANAGAGTPLSLDPSNRLVNIRINNVLQDVGPDALAPQNTFQDNKQTKYDVTWTRSKHSFSFGAEWNKIDGEVYANFFGNGPRVRGSRNAAGLLFSATSPFAAGGSLNPLNYPVDQIRVGNGLGFFSERPALGFAHGGTTNHRLAFYGHDTYKMSQNLTVTYGVRYTWHSALSDHDLVRAPSLSLFDPQLAGYPRRDADDFGPQAGFAWNVFGDGKTVIRGGAGIFYETNVFNNLLFDRVANTAPGLGNARPTITAGVPRVLNPANGSVLFDFSTMCTGLPGNSCFGASLGAAIPFVLQAQQLFTAAAGALAANWPAPGVPVLFDSTRSSASSGALVDNNFKSPYGAQMNIGIQRELRPGLVLAVDYTRNRGVHFNLTRDRNRSGAANTLNPTLALAAMNGAFARFDNTRGAAGGTLCSNTVTFTTISAQVACTITGGLAAFTGVGADRGATISDYAARGLGAGSALDGFAFQGVNPNFRDVVVIENQGLSLYQALQVRLQGKMGSWGWFRNVNANINYSLSRFESTGLDQDFISAAAFNDRPTQFFGPAGLDRTHQVVIGLQIDLPKNFHISTTSAFRSPLANSLFLPLSTGGADEIFFSDLDGDGTVQDPIPGSNRGSFSRSVSSSGLNSLIAAYNSGVVGQQITPAGQALINAGLFTQAQLVSLQATVLGRHGALANTGTVNNDGFFNTDLRFSWNWKLTERVHVEPFIEVFNLFNIANYAVMNNILDGNPGDANNTTRTNWPTRVGAGSGSFAPGVQRAFQLAVRVSF